VTETHTPAMGVTGPAVDAFAAARWFEMLWNSTARAVSADRVEWQCTTWGSGRGGGDWLETAVFSVVAAVFDLPTSRNYDGRDELVVLVPLERFADIVGLIDRLGEEPEGWPWLREDDPDRQIELAAEVLGISAAAVADDIDLLDALRIE
jgi:hypothetical protein